MKPIENVIVLSLFIYINREMLQNISPETGNETLAVYINKKHVSKIRPFIYDMSNQDEVESIRSLLEERP